MSWLFSQALVEEYSAATCSDGEPSAQLSVMPTPHKFWRNDKTMESSQLSRFGLTCAVLTEQDGEDVLTSFLEDFPVRTSASPDPVPGSTVLDRDSGGRCDASFAKYDPASSTWKTPQLSLLEDLTAFSETWPRSGLMRSGECWEQTTVAPLTFESGSGYWATPTVNGNYNKAGLSPSSGDGLATQANKWPTPKSSPSGPDFARMNQEESGGDDLATMVARETFQTPTANEDAAGRPGSKMQKMLANSPEVRGTTEEDWNRGQLNPDWVELLMGWPKGWTSLEPMTSLGDWGHWDGDWEQGVPRVGKGIEFRVDRLKAIGNGQVPLVAATAFEQLMNQGE